MKLFGREPAMLLALVSVVVKLAVAFGWHASVDVQSGVNAVAAGVVAVAIVLIAHDAWGAALLGLIQAAVSLAVGLGLHWSADRQALVMTLATVLVALATRQQVTAPVAASALPSAKRAVQST